MEVRWCVWVELEGVRTDITLKVPDGTTSVYSLCPIKKFVIKKTYTKLLSTPNKYLMNF